jgi:DNA polymerase
MVSKLHIDIETYSSIDIKTAGAYKYCESIDFEILMVAYAFDDEPIQIVDLAQGENLPIEFLEALQNPQVEKHAHNANFERNAFRAVGYDIPIEQWHCSAVKSAYCGLPLSLEMVSKALKLEEKGKLATGKALIRYFCIPCKPTNANDKRMRNMPWHDLEKWDEFKKYCINDVEAEREIDNRLQAYAIPEFERRNYILDQEINDRGIMIDLNMAKNAFDIDTQHSAILTDKMIDLTGLENPNSPAQLKKWLGDAMQKEVTSLAKSELPTLIEEAESEAVTKVLKLRKKSSKTSTKKYVAMMNCACDDDRAHGLFQFYGANRTGRWAGRLVQLQNLPQNHISDLEQARSAFASGDYDLVTMLYENVSDTLSQLIRTAFIAKPGHTFAVADFSAIEARVIAWLANEKWRLDVFSTHGKIYEASASMMFGVPIEKIDKGSDLRTKGKIAELALGYQGALGALKKMGGESMGLTDSEMTDIVKKWRNKNPQITKLWKHVEAAAKRAIKTRKKVILSRFRNLEFEYDGNVLTIQLPSGRKLFYQSPAMTTNRFGQESIKYKGLDQVTKKWWWVDSYGGKFVENIVQAIARDLLADSMLRLDENGFDIVMHVHDEAICEIPEENSDELLDEMCDIMGTEVPWAEGLPLVADGYVTPFYKKD